MAEEEIIPFIYCGEVLVGNEIPATGEQEKRRSERCYAFRPVLSTRRLCGHGDGAAGLPLGAALAVRCSPLRR